MNRVYVMKIRLFTTSKITALALSFALLLPFASCQKYGPGGNDPALVRKVLILYADGYNNLPANMKDDIKDLGTSSPRDYLRDRYTVLVFKHLAVNYDYSKKVHPVLTELYKDADGHVITDTVKVYPDTMTTSSIFGLRQVMEDVKALYPAAEYGLVYSSHGTGWIPEEYYENYDPEQCVLSAAPCGAAASVTGRIDLLSAPEFKSMGCQAYYDGNKLRTKEIDIRKLQDAFPMHMRYIILDACLMGGIETAYQLRGVTDELVFSAAEVPSGGFDYKDLPARVLYSPVPDMKAVCDDFLKMYNNCTAALIKSSGLESLAAACKPLFAKYSDALGSLKASNVQGFYRGDHPWFFDLRDMLVKAKASDEELAALDSALAACVEYKVNSSPVMGIKIDSYCGLSMYMPSEGNAELDAYYEGYDWNADTELVRKIRE